MNKYEIKVPIWDGGMGKRAIGLATFRVPCLVDITYKNSDGDREYPDTYLVTKEFADNYPTKKFNNSPLLYVIPIEDLHVSK
jgi:hypothetical protein